MNFKDIIGEADRVLDNVAKPGIRRGLIRNAIPGYTVGRVIKKIVNGDSIGGALIREGKEIICEDTPGLNLIYDAGKRDGKSDGYVEASDVYEKKFAKQAAEFIQQKNYHERQELEYNHLLDECETQINNLRHKLNKTEADNEKLRKLIETEKKLRSLPKVK